MNRFTALPLLATTLLLTSCAYNLPYRPANPPEEIENHKALLDIYPDDIRTNLDYYTNTIVAWAGIIRSTEANDEGTNNLIRATTTVEHHYFDWQEDQIWHKQKLMVSPRGEGQFKTEWLLRRKTPEANVTDAEKYAAPGKLAIIYGVPETVQSNVVVLKYRYLRVIGTDQFSTNQFDYGRFGEPFRYLGK